MTERPAATSITALAEAQRARLRRGRSFLRHRGDRRGVQAGDPGGSSRSTRPSTFESVHTEGISGVDVEDIEYARELGYRIKHLGIASDTDAGSGARGAPVPRAGERLDREGRRRHERRTGERARGGIHPLPRARRRRGAHGLGDRRGPRRRCPARAVPPAGTPRRAGRRVADGRTALGPLSQDPGRRRAGRVRPRRRGAEPRGHLDRGCDTARPRRALRRRGAVGAHRHPDERRGRGGRTARDGGHRGPRRGERRHPADPGRRLRTGLPDRSRTSIRGGGRPELAARFPRSSRRRSRRAESTPPTRSTCPCPGS